MSNPFTDMHLTASYFRLFGLFSKNTVFNIQSVRGSPLIFCKWPWRNETTCLFEAMLIGFCHVCVRIHKAREQPYASCSAE